MNAYYMIVALQGWVRVDGEGCFNVDSIRLAFIVWQRMPRAHKARCRAHRCRLACRHITRHNAMQRGTSAGTEGNYGPLDKSGPAAASCLTSQISPGCSPRTA